MDRPLTTSPLRPRRRGLHRAAAVALTLGLVLAACGGKKLSDEGSTTDTEKDQSSTV